MIRYYFSLLCFIFCSCSIAQTAQNTPKPIKVNAKGASSIVLPAETGDFRRDMLAMVNAIRSKGCTCGGTRMAAVAPLMWNSQLEQAAIGHAQDMARFKKLDHVGSDGSEIDNRAERAGYLWRELGENIGMGQASITQVMRDWLKSPSHCKQLMSNRITEMGAAQYGKYWVQDFGKPR